MPFLCLLLAALALSQPPAVPYSEELLPPAGFPADRFELFCDAPVRYDSRGRPSVPLGSVLWLRPKRDELFTMSLRGPFSNEQFTVRGRWAQTMAQEGDHTLLLPQGTLDFVVAGFDSDLDGLPDEQDRCVSLRRNPRDADRDGCEDSLEGLGELLKRYGLPEPAAPDSRLRSELIAYRRRVLALPLDPAQRELLTRYLDNLIASPR